MLIIDAKYYEHSLREQEDEGAFNNECQMMGNLICVRTLDLSGDFSSIRKQLDEITEKYLLIKIA